MGADTSRSGGPRRGRGGTPSSHSRLLRLTAVAGGGALLLVAIVAVTVSAARRPAPRPVLWRVVNDTFVVSDESGDELWRKRFEQGLADDYNSPRLQPRFLDLDGNGRLEVLFIVEPRAINESTFLVCYSSTGREMWRFTPGRAVATITESFENIYSIGALAVSEPDAQGQRLIVVGSHHYLYYPTQLALLSPSGKLLAEYWHAGHIGASEYHLTLLDLDHDGEFEIYAAGVNNARRQATLVVLDPATMQGASEDPNVEYQLLGFPPGRERARIFFPRSEVNRALHEPYNVASTVILGRERLVVTVLETLNDRIGGGVHYELTPELRVEQLTFDDGYKAAVQRLQADGVELSPERRQLQALLASVEVEAGAH